MCSPLLLGANLAKVEFKFLALKNVSITTTRLTGTGSDDGIETTCRVLVIQLRINMSEILAGGKFALEMVRTLDFSYSRSGAFLPLPSHSLLSQNLSIMSLPPLSEGCCIHLHDGTLHQCLCPHQLIVACIIGNINDPGLPRDSLRAPRKVTGIKTKGTVLDVATADTHLMNTLGADTGVGRLTTEFILALLTIVSTLCTGMRSLMTGITTYA